MDYDSGMDEEAREMLDHAAEQAGVASNMVDGEGKPLSPGEAMMSLGEDRHFGFDMIDGVEVSTAWLPNPHVPFIETMVFGGPLDHSRWRWASREEAEEGHAAVVKAVIEASL